MPRIHVIGALVYDIVFAVPDWVEPNRAVHATQVTLSPGGKALSQATAASRMGANDVRLIGCVGDDFFGAEMLAALRGDNVNVEHVYVHPSAQTSIAGIIVKDNLPAFIGAPDASRRLNAEQIAAALADLRAGDILLVNFEILQPLVQYALELGRAAGATTVLNPAPFFTRDNFVFNYLHLVDVILPNELEAKLLTGIESDDADALARALQRHGISQVVMTLGDAGSLLYAGDQSIEQRAFELDVVDTTGASDAFVGAFCHALAMDWPSARSLEFASAAAGLACTRRGTMSSLPRLAEVESLLAQVESA